MTPIIKSRQPVTLAPVCRPEKLRKGDIVYVKVGGRHYTHLIHAVSADKVQIGNNHGHMNGWTSFENVYGIVIEIDGVPRRNSQYPTRYAKRGRPCDCRCHRTPGMKHMVACCHPPKTTTPEPRTS